MENIGCYQDKLADEEVFNCFTIIITKSKKFAKPELRVINLGDKIQTFLYFYYYSLQWKLAKPTNQTSVFFGQGSFDICFSLNFDHCCKSF